MLSGIFLRFFFIVITTLVLSNFFFFYIDIFNEYFIIHYKYIYKLKTLHLSHFNI